LYSSSDPLSWITGHFHVLSIQKLITMITQTTSLLSLLGHAHGVALQSNITHRKREPSGKPWHSLFSAGLVLLLLCIVTSHAAAQLDSLLPTETFIEGQPGAWYDDGSWFASDSGLGGANGSMYCDMFDYYYENDYLDAPTVDAGNYQSVNDSVWVDFDLCWQYNLYDEDYGDDYFYVVTDYDELMGVGTSQAYTYNTEDYSVVYDPPTDSIYWQHYHLQVPITSVNSSLNIYFVGSPNWGASNPAIDNVTISADYGAGLTRRILYSRDSIWLGQVRVGSSYTDTLTVSSVGTDGININASSMLNGSEFSNYPNYGDRWINSGYNEIDNATFNPNSTGMFSDSLIYLTNSDTAPEQRLAVYVAGQGVEAVFSAASGSVGFGNVRVGQSTEQTFYYSNTGDDTLFMTEPTFSSSDFSVVSGPTNPVLPPNQSDSIVIQFAPTIWQSYDETMYLSALNGISTPSITLTGVGILPHLEVSSPVSLGTERVGQTKHSLVTFSNTGNDTLHISGPSLAQPGDLFGVGTYSQSVLPGASGTIEVTFSPNQRGLDSAMLNFTTDDPSNSEPGVLVIGQGINGVFSSTYGNTLDFGNVRTGQTTTQTFYFSNVGDDTLYLQTPTFSGNGFSVVSGPSSSVLAPNQSGTVEIKFAPILWQTYNASITFTALNGVSPTTITLNGVGIQSRIQFSSYNFGTVLVGDNVQEEVPFLNTGNDTLNILNASISQPSTQFTLDIYDQSVPPGGTGTALITYAPKQSGTDDAFLVLTTDDPTNLTASIPLSAQGALPQMSVADADQTIDLGQVNVNSVATRYIAVTNNGDWDLDLTSATTTGTAFSAGIATHAIGAGSTGYVIVTFAPNATGSFTGTLVIEGDDPSNPSATIYLTGTGIESSLSVNPVNVNFGLVPVLSTVLDTIELSNTGSATVTINSYSLVSQSGVFMVVDSSATQVGGNGTASVVVSFTPNTTGNYSGTLTISTNADFAPTRTISLSGTGVKGMLAVPQTSYDFGSIVVGNDSTIAVTLSNSGEAGVTINSVSVTGSGFSDGTFSTPQTIPAGGSTTLDLTFEPAAPGLATGTVTMTLADGTQATLALLGEGVAPAPPPASVNEIAAASVFTITVTPNPASSVVTAHIDMAQTTDGTIEMFDVTGHEVLSVPLGLMTAGVYDISLPIRDLSSGSYFVRVANANGDAAAARLVIER
jgi:hypothetical protein